MSETEAQIEPSMEEILASIRRIITEDDSDDKDQAEAAGDGDDGDGDEEPVELTRMVDDEGQVVELQPEGQGNDDEAEADGSSQGDDAAKDDDGDEEDDVSSKLAVAESGTAAEESGTESAEGEEAVELVEPADGQQAAAEKDAEAVASATTKSSGDGLVSPQTEEAAAASLAAVVSAVAVPEQESAGTGGERSLEAVVRDALQPELRGWLDKNLAPLVERIVREEIKKLVRRVEDR